MVGRGRQAAEPGENVEEGAEVALGEAETARHRQPLLGERGGGQRHAGGVALVERELKILLHHADVEPRVARHLADDVRPRYFTIGEATTDFSSASTAVSR